MNAPNLSTTAAPAWTSLARDLIERLRLHHAGHSRLLSNAPEPEDAPEGDDSPMSLEDAFARLSGNKADATEAFSLPVAPIPTPELLMIIRIAAAFGSAEAIRTARQSGAGTILRDIPAADLGLLTDALAHCWPGADWHVLFPTLDAGTVSKAAEGRFHRAIEERLDRIAPWIVLLPTVSSLPPHLLHLGLTDVRLPPVDRDIVMEVVRAGQLGNFLTDDSAFLQALPEDTLLARLDTAHICVALRAPHPTEAARRLHAMTSSHAMTGPRLEAMAGDGPALTAARRLVADLLLWKQGKVAWSDLSRSILLYGPPGTGKTWLARAMGNSAGIACVTGSFAEWQSAGHLGDMLREMRRTFAEARRLRPAILFIDEIDAVGSRTDGDRHGINYRTQVINGFLGEMNSISTEEGVIVIGACNYPQMIDPAVTRAGRFDLKIELPLPDADAILALLRQHLREDIADDELRSLARKAVGRNPAEIDAAIRAARSAARHDRKRLSIAMLRDHLKIGIDDDHPGRLRRIALHEVGHAVIGAALRLGRIDRMMITDEGGTITRTPRQSESLLSDIDAEIAYSLGGRAAERLMLGDVSAGAGGPAHSDLASATRYALDVEAVYGLGLEGPVWHETPGLLLMQNNHLRARVRQRIERAERRAVTILAANQPVLEGLAEELTRQRSMKAAGIDRWLLRVVGEEDLARVAATSKGNTASPAIMNSRAHLPASVEAPKTTPNP